MKNLLLIITFCIYSIVSFAQIKESQAIDSIFLEWNKPNAPGGALGVIKDGELIYSKGYGLANMEYDIPNSPSSVFRIASTSKQFTAACIILLAEQGKLNLDNKLNYYFPEFPVYSKSISIRHLLNHTSGIRDYLTVAYLKGLEEDDYYKDGDIMKWLVSQSDLNFKPGDEFLYSNSGYWLLGQIVNKVSGMNMADFAEKEIFKPLGMSSTHFHNDHKQIVRNRASGYIPSDSSGYKISMTTLDMIGDGGIFTTINDIKKWDDSYYDSSVLSKAFWKMMTDQGVLNNGDKINYASGLGISSYKGLKTINHGGAFVGYRAELIRFPDQHLSVVIFANRGDANPTSKSYQVAGLFLKKYFKNEEVENSSQDKEETKNQGFINLKNKELEKFAGSYWNKEGSYSRKIYVKNDTMRYARSDDNESDLIPVGENVFKMIGVGGDVEVKFEKPKQGNYIMNVSISGGEPIISKAYKPIEYTNKELADFVGNYYSKELDVDYLLKLKDNFLMLYVNGKETSPLQPIMENLFTNNGYGTFQFSADGSGKVSGFKLAAGRVKNLSFEKK